MAILDVPNNISHKDLSNFTVSLQEAALAGYSLAQFEKCRLEVFAFMTKAHGVFIHCATMALS